MAVLAASMLQACVVEPVGEAPTTVATGEALDLVWARFRGPGGQGIREDAGLPVKWTGDSANVRWRAAIAGSGNSSPVVAGRMVFLTAAEAAGTDAEGRDQSNYIALALDLDTGTELWKTTIFTAPTERLHVNNTAAASPVTDGRSVWVYFGSHAARLDLRGKIVWLKEVDPGYRTASLYGIGTSPILLNDLLVIFQDWEGRVVVDEGWLATFDAATGEEKWRLTWEEESCCGYGTPIVWRRAGRTELIVPHSGEVVSYDPQTGERLWDYWHGGWQVVAGALVQGEDMLCTLSGAHRRRTSSCIRLTTDEAGETAVEELWLTKWSPEVSAPIWYRDRVFGVTDGGVLIAHDPQTGERIGRRRITEGRRFRAALVAGDGKLYVAASSGVIAVVDVDAPKLRILSVNSLGDGWNGATPAIADGALLVRRETSLFCIDGKSQPAPAGAG
ncbi:MAG: PQQ-binding-like beta-propeller repeat protein [Acidobacteriota bacterium]|nr:PQQ-binding-like beta-propeller repeat protein [Acidobacteriota bacterium]